MGELPPIQIDHARPFPRLSTAPIVEAVIELRARAETPWEEEEVSRRLTERLPDYPSTRKVADLVFTANFALASGGDGAMPEANPTSRSQRWTGVRHESPDGRFIADFTRDHFSLSRLAPYQEWTSFRDEALRLWQIHAGLAEPAEVQRLGVRFINRLAVPVANLDFGDYFEGLGVAPGSLATAGFLYQDALAVPGHPYVVNTLRTVQQPQNAAAAIGLLLDIDAICPEPTQTLRTKIQDRLDDLRWLKNHVFFSAMTSKALDLCR
jgi:uncharacterized protein (TIGR04255 family)